MYKKYYVNNKAQTGSNDHEVHTDSCFYFPLIVSSTYLGTFDNCKDAVEIAKKLYQDTNGCKYCCTECHNG